MFSYALALKITKDKLREAAHAAKASCAPPTAVSPAAAPEAGERTPIASNVDDQAVLRAMGYAIRS